MRSLSTVILFGFMILMASCEGNKQDSMMSQEVGKTYWDIREIVFENASGEDLEWHGEALDQSASELVFVSENGDCGQADCGKAVSLFNASNAPIEVILQIVHGIGDIHPYFARKVMLGSNVATSVGCSHFCYEGGKMKLTYNIVGAKVTSNQQ